MSANWIEIELDWIEYFWFKNMKWIGITIESCMRGPT